MFARLVFSLDFVGKDNLKKFTKNVIHLMFNCINCNMLNRVQVQNILLSDSEFLDFSFIIIKWQYASHEGACFQLND